MYQHKSVVTDSPPPTHTLMCPQTLPFIILHDIVVQEVFAVRE
jgi:hypothetical protein